MSYCVCIMVCFFLLMAFWFADPAAILLVRHSSSFFFLQVLYVHSLTSKQGHEHIWMAICCLNPTDNSIRLDTVILVAVHRSGLGLNYSTFSYSVASAASASFSNVTISLSVTRLTRASPQPCHPFLLFINVRMALKPRHISTVAEDSLIQMSE